MDDFMTQETTLGNWIHLNIQQEYQNITGYEPDVIKCSESLHQMRVSFRKLRAIINLFGVVLKLPKYLGDESLGSIARTLGELRDLDVLEEQLNNYLLNISSTEQNYLKVILKKTEKHRQQIVTKVNKLLKGKTYRKFKENTINWLDSPKYSQIADLPLQENLSYLLLPCLSNLYLHSGWYLSTDSDGDITDIITKHGKILHGLRKRVKVTRYQLMPFTDLYSPEYADYVEDLKAIQKHLGNIQDTIVINDLLSNYCLEDHYETLPEITKKVQDLQIESWENWQSLKTKYLQSNTKNEWRKIIINNP